MKTTSYEISKKLKEAGFEADADYNFIERNNQKAFLINIKELSGIEIMNEIGVFIKAYDLETLLERICFVIQDLEKDKNYWFFMNQQELSYMSFDGETNIDFYTPRQKNESLADTAGRLLLLLHEKNLIKF